MDADGGAGLLGLVFARMNVMTCQCRAVSSSLPADLAFCGAMSSVHWAGSVRKPSSLTSTLWPA